MLMVLHFGFVSSARSFTAAARRYVTNDVTLVGASDLVAQPADYSLSARRRLASQRHQRGS